METLKSYFTKQWKPKIPESDKFFLYEEILNKKSQKNLTRTRKLLNVNVKSFIYWLSLTLLIVGIYGWYFVQQKESGGNILINPLSFNNVEAWYIANIVHFKWKFEIKHNDIIQNSSMIKDWDFIELMDTNTEITFHLDSETEAKITWPAKFKLNKNNSGEYTINLQYWDFVEIQSIKEETTQDLTILADWVIIQQKIANKPTNFQIIKDWKQQVIKNKWSEIFVKKSSESNSFEIEKEQLLTIEENNFKIREVENFETALKNNKIEQTYAIIENQNTDSQNLDEYKLKTFENIKNVEINTWVLSKLNDIVDSKKVLQTEQDKKLNWLLDKWLLENNIKEIYDTKLSWNTNSYKISYQKLDKRLDQIYLVFDLNSYPSQDIWEIVTKVEYLSNYLKSSFHIPPKYIWNLEKTQKILNKFLEISENQERNLIYTNDLIFE